MGTKTAKLWIFHHYATGPDKSGLTRPYDFAGELRSHGIETTVFSASYLHYSEEQLITDKKRYLLCESGGIPFIFVKTPSYEGNGYSRVKNLFYYCINLAGICRQMEAPDLILASSPHLFTLAAGLFISRKKRVPCICEIRDLWPEAIFYVGKCRRESLAGKLLSGLEHWIYKKADALVFTKEGDIGYLEENGWLSACGKKDVDAEKCFYINNGIHIRQFEENMRAYRLDDPDLADETFKVVYTGALRKVNDLDTIIDAAFLLRGEPDVKFLIYGTGNKQKEWEEKAERLGLGNILFKGRIEKKYIPYVLSCASVNLLHYSNRLYNWSRGSSSNKLFEYMAAGRPILSTIEMGYSLIGRYGCGVEVKRPGAETIAKAILAMRDAGGPAREEMGRRAREGAGDFDIPVLAGKLVDVIGYAQREWGKKQS